MSSAARVCNAVIRRQSHNIAFPKHAPSFPIRRKAQLSTMTFTSEKIFFRNVKLLSLTLTNVKCQCETYDQNNLKKWHCGFFIFAVHQVQFANTQIVLDCFTAASHQGAVYMFWLSCLVSIYKTFYSLTWSIAAPLAALCKFEALNIQTFVKNKKQFSFSSK